MHPRTEIDPDPQVLLKTVSGSDQNAQSRVCNPASPAVQDNEIFMTGYTLCEIRSKLYPLRFYITLCNSEDALWTLYAYSVRPRCIVQKYTVE